MSNIGEIKDAVRRHLSVNLSPADLFQGESSEAQVLNEIDAAILRAANNARTWAERRHDFAENWLTAQASLVPGENVSLDSDFVDYSDGSTAVVMRTVENVLLSGDYGAEPLRVTTRKDMAWEKMKAKRLHAFDRYPGDEGDLIAERSTAVIAGRKLWIEPQLDETTTVYVEGYKWMDPYYDDDDTDFLIQRGFDFMMWACVVEVNHMVLKFVNRQEGTIQAPIRLRDEAWDGLILNDSHSVEGNIYHDL